MELPLMPKLVDFPGDEYGYNWVSYKQALDAWERVCKAIVSKIPADVNCPECGYDGLLWGEQE